MPIGAFRLNTLSAASAAAAPFTSGVTALSNSNWNYTTYSAPEIGYVGADTSGNPVWLWAFKDATTGYTKAMLFKVGSTGTVTQSSVTTIDSTNSNTGGGYDPMSHTEYPNNSQGWVYYVASDGTLYAKTFSIDKDALTIGTPGSAASLQAGASFIYASYAGNSRGWVTHRATTLGTTLVSRSTNTITKIGTIGGLGDQSVLHSAIGFDYAAVSSGMYRYAGQTYGPNMEAGYFNGSSASTVQNFGAVEFLTGFSYTNGNPMVNVNGTNKFVIFGKSSTNGVVARAATITWPTTGTAAPTYTAGTQISLTDAANGGLWGPAKSPTADECYFVYKNNSNSNWYYRKLTLSGNTITEGAATQITNAPTNATGFIHSMSYVATTSTGTWLVFLTDNSTTTTADVTVVKIA